MDVYHILLLGALIAFGIAFLIQLNQTSFTRSVLRSRNKMNAVHETYIAQLEKQNRDLLRIYENLAGIVIKSYRIRIKTWEPYLVTVDHAEEIIRKREKVPAEKQVHIYQFSARLHRLNVIYRIVEKEDDVQEAVEHDH